MAEDAVLGRLRGKVAAGEISGIRVRVRVAGGMPAEQHLDRMIDVDSSGAATASAAAGDAAGPAQGRGNLPEEVLATLIRQLSEGADGLVPRSEARFLPDSLVGSVVFEVDGETTELFYLADEQDRIAQNKPIPPATAAALNQLQRLGDQLARPAASGPGGE